MINYIVFLLLIIKCLSLMEKYPFYIGKWSLRSTNDESFQNSNTFLVIKHNDKIKLKSIYFNGFLAIKVSRKGVIKSMINNLLFTVDLNNVEFLTLLNKNIDILLQYNNKNTYSYSILGIEIPEIKFLSNSSYISSIKFNIIQKDNTLLIKNIENENYYLFDLNTNDNNKLPHIEIPISTLILSQVISFLINLIIVKSMNINF